MSPAQRPAGRPRTLQADSVRARLDETRGRTPAERVARGKAARAAVPRDSHAAYTPARDRRDPVRLLEQQAATRLPELAPIRYGRMLASPFAFLRGGALLMAADLSATPASGLIVQACGDAHLANFGIFASPERRLVFDINDFDETLPAPWEWDIKRLATSLEVAGRGNGYSAKQRRAVARAAVTHYRQAMRRLAGLGTLDVWYSSAELDQLQEHYQAILSAPERKLAGSELAAGTGDMQELAKLTHLVHGRPRIISAPPRIVPLADLPSGGADDDQTQQLHRILAGYRRTLESDRGYLVSQFDVADLARQVVGVGSVGMRCWIALLFGRDQSDPLFLQVKEAQRSVLSAFAGASPYHNEGQRVVAGQRLMQVASDIFLGWHRTGPGSHGRRSAAAENAAGSTTATRDSRRAAGSTPGQRGWATDFYVRQLRDWKFSIATQAMRPQAMQDYGQLCGATLARAHARSGDRIAIAAYLGKSAAFDDAVAEFAAAYAEQNARDYASLRQAVAAGKLTAERGV